MLESKDSSKSHRKNGEYSAVVIENMPRPVAMFLFERDACTWAEERYPRRYSVVDMDFSEKLVDA